MIDWLHDASDIVFRSKNYDVLFIKLILKRYKCIFAVQTVQWSKNDENVL